MRLQKTIRILLVDDHPLVLDGIRTRVQDDPSIEVIGEASNGEEALQQAKTHSPDLVLMDISMPVMNGLEAMRHFNRDYPDIKVIILSMHENREYIVKLIQSGASGYILKDVASGELINAIKTVSNGGTYFSSSASQSLFHKGDGTPQLEKNPLTSREETVLKLLSEGDPNKVIARKLDISVRTVETHRKNIKQKLNIQTAAGLTKYAIEHNL